MTGERAIAPGAGRRHLRPTAVAARPLWPPPCVAIDHSLGGEAETAAAEMGEREAAAAAAAQTARRPRLPRLPQGPPVGRTRRVRSAPLCIFVQPAERISIF